MPLVEYSSSSESEASSGKGRKRKRASPEDGKNAVKSSEGLPQLPASFHDLYAAGARSSTHDDPALHGGRKRTVPHVEGRWPSHVYLEWLPSETEHGSLTNLLRNIEEQAEGLKLNTLLTSPLSTSLPLHVSLSAPLSIASEKKDTFVERLQQTLPPIGSFRVKLSGLHWVSNHERTRWFLVLRCEQPEGDVLDRLLRWANGVCASFGLDQLYVESKAKDASTGKRRRKSNDAWNREMQDGDVTYDFGDRFHFSIAWLLQEPGSVASLLDDAKIQHILAMVQQIEVNINSVKVKIGNVVTTLSLRNDRVDDQRGILA